MELERKTKRCDRDDVRVVWIQMAAWPASQGRPGELPRRAPDKRGLATSSAVWRLERRCGPEASSPAGGGVGVGFGLPRRRRQRYRFGFFAIFKKKFFSYIFLPNFLRTLDWKSPERSSLATASLTSTRQLSSHQNI